MEVKLKFKHILALEPKFFSFTFKVEKLPCGDIACMNMGAERKTLADFVGSIHDMRIFSQAFRMSQNYEFAYLFVVGDYTHIKEVDLKGIYTTIADIKKRYKFDVMFFPNNEIMFYYFLMQCLKNQQDLKPIWHYKKPTVTVQDEQVEILCGAMGCGPKTAKKFLLFYKSIENFILFWRDSIKMFQKYPKTKSDQHFFELFTTEYQEKSKNEEEVE